jgi:hypothetical protein
MGVCQINYNTGSTTLYFQRGPLNFIAEDSVRRHDNIATSGVRESVYEANDILISFTMPGLLMGTSGAADYAAWKNFFAWARPGGSFQFCPNNSVLVSAAPWSGAAYYFNCLLEDTGFKPKKLGMGRYSLDVKFRVAPGDAYAPDNAGQIMEAFWGLQPV